MVDEFYLREDVINSKTKEPYAVKGDKVKFIADHDNCYVVESEKNVRFGIAVYSLSKEKIEKKVINILPNTKNKKRK
jgi:hypothetical protein